MKYVFTAVHPPLVRDGHDPRSVSELDLKKDIGRAVWNTSREVSTSRQVYRWDLFETKYDLTRYYRWTLKQGPIHKGEDFTMSIKDSVGFQLVEKNTFENTLDISASAGGNIGVVKLDASIRNTLHITDEITKTWHVDQEVTRNIAFKGGVSYWIWALEDVFYVEKTVVVKHLFGEGKDVVGVDPPKIFTSGVSCGLGDYEDDDKVAPKGRRLLDESISFIESVMNVDRNEKYLSDDEFLKLQIR